jgi:hypothetical protein
MITTGIVYFRVEVGQDSGSNAAHEICGVFQYNTGVVIDENNDFDDGGTRI